MQLGALGGVNVPFAATGDLTVEGGLRHDLLKQDAFAEKAVLWAGAATASLKAHWSDSRV